MAVNLENLPVPAILMGTAYEELFELVLTDFRSKNTDYSSIVEGDPGYTLLEAMAYIGTLFFSQISDSVKAVLITHATGTDLDVLAATLNVERRTDENEPDDLFRQRAVDSLETLAIGSESWYGNYALQASTDVKDARVIRKPDPMDPDADIPGEVVVYVQGVSDTIPSVSLLSTVKNYLNADGAAYGGNIEAEAEAEARRFLCDTVNVEPVTVFSYNICAIIHVEEGLSKVRVLEDIQSRAEDFVSENEMIGNKIPLSAIYAVLDTDSVSEVTLSYPVVDIVPDKMAVPVAFGEETLELQEFKSYSAWTSFGLVTGAGFSIVPVYNSKSYIVFTQDFSAADQSLLNLVGECRRVRVYSLNSDGEADEILYTYQVNGSIGFYENPSNSQNPNDRVHYYFELQETVTDISDLTSGRDYEVRFLNSLFIEVANL